jgi:RNA methyltransferase, TrmH family
VPTHLESTKSPRVAHLRSLHSRKGRRRSGHFLAEGSAAVEAAWAAQCISELWVAADAVDRLPRGLTPDVIATDAVMRAVCETKNPQGMIAVCTPTTATLDQIVQADGPIVIADAIADPGNLGTIIRTLAAVGGAGLIIGPDSVDPFNGKVIRSTAGAFFRLPMATQIPVESAIDAARAAGRSVAVAAADGQMDLVAAIRGGAVTSTSAWVIGSEAHGVGAGATARADHRIRIPMPGGIESLNAAVAAAICLYTVIALTDTPAP